MSFLIPVAMFGFLPFVVWLFGQIPPRRAALLAFLSAWMFLPNYTYHFPGMPEYNKTFAASLAVLLATWLRDRQRLRDFSWKWADGLMLLWCFTPLLASLSNDLGLYDGLSSVKNYLTIWFAPWLIGRLYFSDAEGIRELLWGLFLGALIYAPLCWLEIEMSPQLHRWVYGYHAHEFLQTVRAIGYRPTVFMQHGLMVGMWMAGGSLAGLVLWRWDGSVKKIGNIPMKFLVIFVLATTLACQSIAALFLLSVGYLTITLARRTRTAFCLKLLVMLPVIAVAMKISGMWTGHSIVDLAAKVSEERAASFEFRVVNEEMLISKALARPLFGWGGWGRSRIYDQEGNDISVTDSFWIIVFGETGIVGLLAFASIISAPVMAFLKRYPPSTWQSIEVGRAAPLAMLLGLYLTDAVINDMKSPLYMLIAGALVSFSAAAASLKTPETCRVTECLLPTLSPRIL